MRRRSACPAPAAARGPGRARRGHASCGTSRQNIAHGARSRERMPQLDRAGDCPTSDVECRPCINCISCRLQIILVIWAEISSIAALDTAGPGAASPRPHAAINCIFISALNLAPARPLPSHYTLGRAKMQIFQYQAGFCSSSAATCPLCLHHPSVLVWLCEVATHRPRHHTTATWQGWRIELPTKVHEDFIITKKAFSY